MQLTETTFSESFATVDRDNGVIRGVRILGSESANGRDYSPGAMGDGARLYEGARVNFDHPERSKAGAERKFGEWVGELRECKLDPARNGVYGNLWLLKSHPNSDMLFEAAERFPGCFGLSHNAEGDCVRKGGRDVVESLTHVNSVDIVTQPATNNGLFESLKSKDKAMTQKTIRQILDSSPVATKGRTQLLEMVDEGTISAELPVPADDAVAPEEQIKQGLLAAVIQKLETATEEQLQGVLDSLDLANTVTGNINSEAAPAAETPETPNKPEEEVAESLRRELANANARNLLLESGRDATPERVRAVAISGEADKQLLIESWPPIGSNARPARSAPITRGKHLTEGCEERHKKRMERVHARLAK